MKSDKSIHNICIASIKRSTMKPYNFKWTKFYESNTDFLYSGLELNLTNEELIICSMFMDADNYSILTTQRLITKERGFQNIGNLTNALDKKYGDFKGYKSDSFTFGLVQLENGTDMKYFIETGKASMIMINGVKTFIKIQKMTIQQIDKVASIWNRKIEK